MKEPMFCEHPDFEARVTVNRLSDTHRFTADVRITCVSCRVPFRFLGLPCGVHNDGPTVSANAEELRAPIAAAPDVLSLVDGSNVSERRTR